MSMDWENSYKASALARAARRGRLPDGQVDHAADTVLVVGGLYGNLAALATIEAMAEAESRQGARVAVVFNGDFNFFNAHESDFRELNRRVLFRQPSHSSSGTRGEVRFLATAGNIELAIAGGAAGTAGCGCDYPAYVSQDVVKRSDLIVERLGKLASACGNRDADGAEILRTMASLPLFETLEVGGRRVGVIHGDPQTLSGWSFGVELMSPPDERLRASLGCANVETTPISLIHRWFAEAEVDLFACTHTCLPFAQRFPAAGSGWCAAAANGEDVAHVSGGGRSQRSSDGLIFNNGSAGMANFSGCRWGLITRISTNLAQPPASVYGCVLPSGSASTEPTGGAHERGRAGEERQDRPAAAGTRSTRSDIRVDAVKVEFDNEAFEERFLALWPPGSPAFDR